MKKCLLVGGFKPGQSLWSIKEGFELMGWEVVYAPTRGCVESHRERDIALAREEADVIREPEQWVFPHKDDLAFQDGLCATLEKHRPQILLWWFSKDDRPSGLIEHIRQQYPWCKTVTHTQDDPWDLRHSPHFTAGFEYVVTCCKESVAEYEGNGLKAIVLYPPPAAGLHRVAAPARWEACDFSITVMSIYAREGGDPGAYLKSADPIDRITHPIPFPQQRVLRQEVVAALKDLGRVHIYCGLGYGTFEELPRSCYRGFKNYFELPGVYAAAKININHHNSPMSYGYLNQRDTAITGSGGFMLTDHVEGIDEIFATGSEIDTWKTLEELQDKAKWWLAHDREREQAARRAKERVIGEYGNVSYTRKLIEFVEA